MKMKTRSVSTKALIGVLLYELFTVACGCINCLFPDQQVLLFRVWYSVTAAIWLVLAVTMVVLAMKRLKLKKLKDEINHWKG